MSCFAYSVDKSKPSLSGFRRLLVLKVALSKKHFIPSYTMCLLFLLLLVCVELGSCVGVEGLCENIQTTNLL